jgi:hypothetical protein
MATGVALILFSPSSSEAPKPAATSVTSLRLVPSLGGAALVGSF